MPFSLRGYLEIKRLKTRGLQPPDNAVYLKNTGIPENPQKGEYKNHLIFCV
jgi:hypothetical protein